MDFAIVGAGRIGALRAGTVVGRPDCRLVAVSDPNQEAAKAAAGASGARVFADHREMLAAAKPAAVICAAPVQFHEAICLESIAAGAHVLCEKPLTPRSEAGRRVLAAATAAGRTVAIGFNNRLYPSFAFLKRCLDDGVLGRIDHARAFGGHNEVHSFPAEWMYRGDLAGGGVMMDIGLHLTDLCRYALGDVKRVQAKTTGDVWKIPGSEDNAIAVFETAAGVPIRYHATWNEWNRFEISLEVYGDRGMVRAAYAPMENLLVLHEAPGKPRTYRRLRYRGLQIREKLKGWRWTTTETFRQELDGFLARIAGRPGGALATGEDGVRATEIAEACYRSSREGNAVST